MLWDVTRIGFIADDFLFLDAARRLPPSEVLLGHHGIYPWYRPLARELYFYAALLGGEGARLVAALISLATAAVAVRALAAIGQGLGAPRVGLAAAALFAAHALTKFVTGWASGYQDLLSITLVLVAAAAETSGRTRLAVVAAALAPLAKETGLVALPLVAAARWARTARPPGARLFAALGGALGAVVLVNAVARATWVTGGNTRTIVPDPGRAFGATFAMLRGFVGGIEAPTWAGLAAAAVAGGACWLLLAPGDPTPAKGRKAPARRPLVALAAAGAALGLAPIFAGNLLGLSVTNTYYAFPAVPWIALLLAAGLARLPGRGLPAAVAAIVAWNVAALAWRAPDLDRPGGWIPDEPGWRESVRVSAATERFGRDLAAARGAIPRGGSVLYVRMPTGSFFVQGDDGAATRELLRDPTARGYFIGAAPADLSPDSMTILTFRPETGHLAVQGRDDPSLLVASAQRLILGDPATARTLAGYAAPADARAAVLRGYLLGAARVAERGAAGLADAYAAAQWPDSSSPRIPEVAAALTPDPDDTALAAAYGATLARPLDAAAQRALADSALMRDMALPAGLALRLAVSLDGGSSVDDLVIGGVLEVLGIPDEAAGSYRRAIARNDPPGAAQQARALLAEIERKLAAAARPARARW